MQQADRLSEHSRRQPESVSQHQPESAPQHQPESVSQHQPESAPQCQSGPALPEPQSEPEQMSDLQREQSSDRPRPRIFPWDSEEQISSLLKLTSMSMRKQIERALRPLGLTQQQGLTLRILLHHPGSTHSDLERILRIEKPSVTNLISVMERRGWVIRKKDEQDARFKQIHLTSEGEELAGRIDATVEQTKSRMMNALSDEEILLLKSLLKKLRKSWEDEPKEDSRP